MVMDNLGQAYQVFAFSAQTIPLILSRRWKIGHETYIRAFVDIILYDKEPPVSLEGAYENVRILEQICSLIDATNH